MSWEVEAARHVKRMISDRNLSYKELAERLQAHGIKETYVTVASKLSRGRFSFIWFMQCMAVMGVRDCRLLIEEPFGRAGGAPPLKPASSTKR